MSKKLKPLTIFLSDDELVNFKSHFDEFLNMNCDDKIKEQKEEIERLNNIIKEVREYIMSELISEWDIKNDGYVSGSDLPADAITPILEILDKGSEKE